MTTGWEGKEEMRFMNCLETEANLEGIKLISGQIVQSLLTLGSEDQNLNSGALT